jgi:hypothetical protein
VGLERRILGVDQVSFLNLTMLFMARAADLEVDEAQEGQEHAFSYAA